MSEVGGTTQYTVREVVGVFPTPVALETAVDELEKAGVTRAAISVLGAGANRPNRLHSLYSSAQQIADDPAAQRKAFVSSDAQTEGEVVAIALPFLVGGFGGAWAVAAAGGMLAAAIGVTLAGGVVGAGVGALLLRAVARHHADSIHEQLVQGGLVLWVSTPDAAAEQRALDVLRCCGGSSVHAHMLERSWGVDDRPLHDVQPDPFLERDK